MKIATILGTRPEIIKMAPILDEIKKRGIESVLIHTGQHYDVEMSDNFFKDLEISMPDYNIQVGSANHGKQTGLMMKGIEEILLNEKVDIVLVQGDTNAVLAGALVAKKLNIPVGHVEAGLRSFDLTMPEEINRKVTDITTSMYFVPTEQSAINLLAENLPKENIIITGNTIVDACFRHLKIAQKQSSELNLDLDNILTVTLHRAENTDDKERLMNILDALKQLTEMNIIFPIHPRTRKLLEEYGLWDDLLSFKHIHIIKPIGYLDFLFLLSKSTLICTDSGGIQEEAITLNIPTLTLRYNTERPETVEAGGNILVGADTNLIVENARKIINDKSFVSKMKNAPNPYGNGDAAIKTVDAILDFYKKGLLNIKSPNYISNSFTRKINKITENITVIDFENKYNAVIHLVFNGKRMEFPKHDLQLNGKMISYDLYK